MNFIRKTIIISSIVTLALLLTGCNNYHISELNECIEAISFDSETCYGEELAENVEDAFKSMISKHNLDIKLSDYIISGFGFSNNKVNETSIQVSFKSESIIWSLESLVEFEKLFTLSLSEFDNLDINGNYKLIMTISYLGDEGNHYYQFVKGYDDDFSSVEVKLYGVESILKFMDNYYDDMLEIMSLSSDYDMSLYIDCYDNGEGRVVLKQEMSVSSIIYIVNINLSAENRETLRELILNRLDEIFGSENLFEPVYD